MLEALRLFSGKELDEETGLYYFGARYYDPRTSAWQNPDPILASYLGGSPAGGVFQPANLNLYGYVWQNPVKLTDPNGTNPGLCNSGIYGVAQCVDMTTGNFWVDNFALGPVNQALNLGVSAANMVADPLIAAGTAIEPYGPTIDGLVMSTPVPHDDAAKLVTGSARVLANVGRAKIAERMAGATGKGAVAGRVGPGPYAKDSIPAGPSARPSAAQQQQINEIGQANGCHTCGTKDPGTKSGNFVGDHQPPTKLSPPGGQQQYLPQCQNCSNVQGGRVRQMAVPSTTPPFQPEP